jgi:cyclopropane fatty-acyl-phospholipid synthase-like methyltransferase
MEVYVLLPLFFLLCIVIISVFIGVPYLPTHKKQAKTMMDLAGIKEGTKVVDLGSGAGRLLFLAARRGAYATGYELNPFLALWTKVAARVFGLHKKVTVRTRDLYGAKLAEFDVVFTFLMNRPMKKLENKLFSELKPGALIVSYTFPIPNKEPIVRKDAIFVYRVD